MAAFKDEINAQVVALWAERLDAPEGWAQETAAALPALELKARVQHVAQAMWALLGPDAERAVAAVVEAALREPVVSSFASWPAFAMIGAQGLEHPESSLEALATLTHLFSAEFAVRPYIERYPELSMRTLLGWAQSPQEHRRRLASEGCRTRLPWGGVLRGLVADPSPILPILEALRDDESEYVRRSVANSINDLSRDHVQMVIGLCQAWAVDAPGPREKLIKHGLRTLIKAGDPAALAVIGVGEPCLEGLELSASPVVQLGEPLHLSLRAVLPEPQKLVVDFALHLLRKRGTRGRKVFKWRTFHAPAGPLLLEKRHRIKAVTVRSYYAGVQRVEVLVNGRSVGVMEFELVVP